MYIISKSEFQVLLLFCTALISVVNVVLTQVPAVPCASHTNEPETVDWAYSPTHLMQLSILESELYQDLRIKDSITSDQFNTSGIQWWMKQFRENFPKETTNLEPSEAEKIAEIICSHPFLTLRMIKRFNRLNGAFGLGNPDMPKDEMTKGFYARIKKFQKEFMLPNEKDVRDVIKNILDIQFTYDLNANDLFVGKFRDVETDFVLTLEEAYELGSVAYEIHRYPEALDWLEIAYRKIQQNPNDSTSISKEQIFGLILDLTRTHDEFIDTFRKSGQAEGDNYHRFTHKINSKHSLTTVKEYDVWKFKQTQNLEAFPAFSLLCAGDSFRTQIERSKLHCWLDGKSDLAWTISPLKIEAHSWNPYLIQIYDVVGDSQILGLKNALLPKKEPAPNAHQDKLHSTCGLANASMSATCSPGSVTGYDTNGARVIEQLIRKIEKISQLVVSSRKDSFAHVSEKVKISTYVFGDQFLPHVDTFGNGGPDDEGDRLATFLLYLNTVHRGGYTVFTRLGAHATPVKGSAIFWYNLLRNGTPDARMEHAGCPVILGQKYIASYWLRYNANFQTRKCSTNEFE